MNRLLPLRLLPLLATATLLVTPGAAHAQMDDGSTARVKFSDPAQPGTLKLSLPWAEARITGTDGNEVVVTSTLDQKGRNEVDREGFRRLDEDVTFELLEKNNVAVISIAGDDIWATHGAEFEIQVPRNTNLIIRTEVGGDLIVDGVEGDLDINSMNGEITLRDIANSAVVNSLNGEISASFKRAPVKPVSLTSLNGEIDVHLPSDTKANLRMRTHNGSIRTNFPASVLETQIEQTSGKAFVVGTDSRDAQRDSERDQLRAERDHARAAREMARAAADIARHVTVVVNGQGVTPVPPVPPVSPVPNFGGKSIIGTLNGGGVDIKVTSMNGTITLREVK